MLLATGMDELMEGTYSILGIKMLELGFNHLVCYRVLLFSIFLNMKPYVEY